MDTLLLPSSGMKRATVRWVPGPAEVTGTGYALLHCHIMPHSDEGCIMKTQILDKRCPRALQSSFKTTVTCCSVCAGRPSVRAGASCISLACVQTVLIGFPP